MKHTTEHWKVIVQTWFEFYKQRHDGNEPTFRGVASKSLKEICHVLRGRVEAKGNTWDEKTAVKAVLLFLDKAWSNQWLKNHFTLQHINSQIDIILNTPANGLNGKAQQVSNDNAEKLKRIIQGNF